MRESLADDARSPLPLVLSDRAERPGLGLEFLAAVHATHALIRRHPEIGVQVRPRIRRALLQRFPYGMFYVNHERHTRVLAVIIRIAIPHAGRVAREV